MRDLLFLVLALIPFTALNLWRLRGELHMLQLTGYFPERYVRWFRTQGLARYRQAREPYLLFAVLPGVAWGAWLVFAIFETLIWLGRRDRVEKKPLVMTRRAARAYACSLVLLTLFSGAALALLPFRAAAAALALIQLGSPVVMWLTSLIMKPIEDAINRSYLNDARRIVRSMPNLRIVGITGSYGKTSTKHVLAELLGESRNVLHTPGSFNTPMGVTRTVREQLRASHEIFIAEMGARQPGNIRELCELTPPHAGILTAIGEQHLETFGTLEALQRTKWELAESLPADGFLVCNVDHAAVRDILARAPIRARVIRCGMTAPEADHRAENLSVTAAGISFDLVRPGHPPLRLTTRLLGRHNVINITLAAVTALELGVTPESIRIAVSGLRPVPHRLELKRNASGFLILDNAFSSNPAGAASALEMLKLIEGGRKVLITPGMVELGAVEYACNKTFGVQAAAAADVVVLVGRQRAVAIHEGLREAGFPEERVVVAEDLKAASAWMHANLKPGDVILFENDLPDTYLG